MKITNQQWIEIIKLISTFLIGIITALTVQSCTMSLSVSKNNSTPHKRPNKLLPVVWIVLTLILTQKIIKKWKKRI